MTEGLSVAFATQEAPSFLIRNPGSKINVSRSLLAGLFCSPAQSFDEKSGVHVPFVAFLVRVIHGAN